jgi:hypothetical protein
MGTKNYNFVRPKGSRRFPVTVASPGTPESYTEFAAMLEGTYDIHLDQHALPRPASNTESQKSLYHPSEFWFYRELIKVREVPY